MRGQQTLRSGSIGRTHRKTDFLINQLDSLEFYGMTLEVWPDSMVRFLVRAMVIACNVFCLAFTHDFHRQIFTKLLHRPPNQK